MYKGFIKTVVRSAWKIVPVPVRGPLTTSLYGLLPESELFRAGHPTLPSLLENMNKNGFAPETIIDIGANVGNWGRIACRVFPSARFFLIDGDPDNEPFLRDSTREIGIDSEYSILILGSEKKDAVTFYKLGAGSSVLPELTSFERSQVTLPMRTLDEFMGARTYRSPVLLKLDVQGFELQVLLGGTETLSRAEVVIMETSMLPYNENAPLFADVIAFMAERGFLAFDFFGQARRQSDGALIQMDVAFVRKDSDLRAYRKVFLHEP